MTQNRPIKSTEQKASPLGACLGLFMFFASTIALVGAFVPPMADEGGVIDTVSDIHVNGLTDW